MTNITSNIDPNNSNHIKVDYTVDKVFLNFPSKQIEKRIVNGTASERTVKAGTLMGIVTADQTLSQPVASDGADGSEVPFGFLLYDTVIPAGAAEEVDALIGWNGSAFEDKIVLEKVGDTLDTVMTGVASIVLGQSIRNAVLNTNAKLNIEPTALNLSDFSNEQV